MGVDDLYLLLRADHLQARGIVDTVSDPMVVLDTGLRVLTASRSFLETFRVDRAATIGRRIYDLGNGQWDIPDLRLLLERVIPRSSVVMDFEVVHDFPAIGRRIMLVSARTLHHPDNQSHSMLVSFVDATERRRREAAEGVLLDEVRHRIGNLLASVSAIARLTSTKNRTAAEYRDALLARIGALVSAHDIVFGDRDGSKMADLVDRILAPYSRPDSIAFDTRDDVDLGGDRLLSVSMVLHELATNAAKHGALSSDRGKVRIGWSQDDDAGAMRLSWTERGGPPVSPPGRKGYGSKLIGSLVTRNLGGQVDLRYKPEGLEAEIVVPLG